MKDIQNILKDLYLISGLNMSVFDIDENLITSYPTKKCPFCHLISLNDESLNLCNKCDKEAFERVKKTGKISIYQCHFHLYEACVPLYTYGIHTGYLMMGQTLTSSHFDKEELKRDALPYIKNEKELDLAIEQISTHSKDQILALASLVDIYAKYLTLTNRIEAKNKDLPQEVKQYIMQNYQNDITIEHLCSYFYCSKATLINKFKEKYGCTVHQFLLEYRLEKSKEYLNNDKLSIQEIALTIGFTDANYFSKAFKKQYNISPTQYKYNLSKHNNL